MVPAGGDQALAQGGRPLRKAQGGGVTPHGDKGLYGAVGFIEGYAGFYVGGIIRLVKQGDGQFRFQPFQNGFQHIRVHFQAHVVVPADRIANGRAF